MREITFSALDLESIRSAAKQTRAVAAQMEEMATEICRRLAEIGVQVANIYYIPEGWSGNTDVTVTAEPIPNGYKVVASGKDVFFMEFGAGVTAGLGYDASEITPPVSIEPGSWSETHKRQYSEKGYWYYKKQMFDGLAPQMGMYHGHKEVRQRVEEVVKEVFERD